jgi:hypothetical protein
MGANLRTAQEVAAVKGGRCLGVKAVPMSCAVRWECREGHQWQALLSNVIHKGTWCPECAPKTRRTNRKNNLARAQVLAAEKGGRCLATENFTIKTQVAWECAAGHQWETPFYVVRRGNWCGRCGSVEAGKALRGDNLRIGREIAAERGGECLAEENFAVAERVRWRCAKGHEWRARFSNVSHGGRWCPWCPLKSETFCREVLSALFPKHTFDKTRSLPWLPVGVGGRPLELDMYNEALQLALEFNGFLHEGPVEAFGGAPLYAKILVHDARKAEACSTEGICLIVVPASEVGGGNGRTAKRRQIVQFIWDAVEDLGYPAAVCLPTLEALLDALGGRAY